MFKMLVHPGIVLSNDADGCIEVVDVGWMWQSRMKYQH